MRKTVFTIAALLVSLTSGGAVRADNSQGEEQGTNIEGTMTVMFVAGQSCAPGDTACNACVQTSKGFFVEAQGIAQTTVGPLFVQVLKCEAASLASPYGGYAGTLTLSDTPTVAPTNGTANFPLGDQANYKAYSLHAPPKDALLFNYVAHNDGLGDFYGFGPFEGTVTVESAIGKFQGAQGHLDFIASANTISGAALGTTPILATGTAFYHFYGTLQGISQ